MTLLDFIETWWFSMRSLLEQSGVIGRFERSSSERLNPSCNLNLRRAEFEADLLVWDSGEAELSTADAQGIVSQQHFDDIRTDAGLAIALSRLASLASRAPLK